MKITKLWLIALLLSLWLLPGPTMAEPNGVIRGRVRNGTPGSGSVKGLEVVLHSFQGQTEGETHSTTLDAEGSFAFEGLETATTWSYLPKVTYEGVTYSQGILAFEADQTEITVEITVYETTRERDGIRADRAHLLIGVDGTTLTVTELYVIINPGDRTYVGTEELEGRRWTSRFYLPTGAHTLTFDDGTLGGRFLAMAGGFVDAEPLWPGRTNIMFSYRIDCATGRCDLSREITYDITNLNVLIPSGRATIVSDQLLLEGTVGSQQEEYQNLVARNIPAGERLDIRVRLAGTAFSGSTSPSASRLPWYLLGGVLAALAVLYPFWRQRVRAAAWAEFQAAQEGPQRQHKKDT